MPAPSLKGLPLCWNKPKNSAICVTADNGQSCSGTSSGAPTSVILAPMLSFLCLIAAAHARTKPAPRGALVCKNEMQQEIPQLQIDLLNSTGSVIASSGDLANVSSVVAHDSAAVRKLCFDYPAALEQLAVAWTGFVSLGTYQFVFPQLASLSHTVAAIRVNAPVGTYFDGYYQDQKLQPGWQGLVVDYPPRNASVGAPVHLSLVPNGRDDVLQAIWVSFEQPAATTNSAAHAHSCKISGDLASGLYSAGNCDISPPAWGCYVCWRPPNPTCVYRSSHPVSR
jgi:hypothetical protein